MTYDAVVVGARCAGSVLSGLLAREGWSVLLVDKARFPSDTISTHAMFPNTLARLEELGILDRLADRHELTFLRAHWRLLDFDIEGEYTPVGGHSRGLSVRRVALDSVLVDWAADAGVEQRLGARVRGLVGTGTKEEPVRGVVLDGGEEIAGRWVFGADGRASTVASLLGLQPSEPMAGEMSYLLSYWRGLPAEGVGVVAVNDERMGLMHNPSEDGTHLLSVAGPPEMTRGSTAAREAEFDKRVRGFPDVLDPGLLERAERISDLVVVPETMMRGFFRTANGPGWALVGDAGHFKHPGTAQGISDAVESAVHVAAAVTGEDPELDGFDAWRRERSEEHYEWSFAYGRWPSPEVTEPYMRGLTSDPQASQDWLDTFTRVKKPSEVHTPDRLARWFTS